MRFTPRQQAILDFIREEQENKGVTPSTREIQARFGFASQTSVMDHLRALKKKGAIVQSNRIARSIVLPGRLSTPPPAAQRKIPIFGSIPAGMPSDADQPALGSFSIDEAALLAPKNADTFALRVSGDSMVGAGIFDGDLVILELKPPKSGNIVAALIDGETTLEEVLRVVA